MHICPKRPVIGDRSLGTYTNDRSFIYVPNEQLAAAAGVDDQASADGSECGRNDHRIGLRVRVVEHNRIDRFTVARRSWGTYTNDRSFIYVPNEHLAAATRPDDEARAGNGKRGRHDQSIRRAVTRTR